MEHSFVFTGGIVMTANRPFPERPELEAVKTRIEYMHLAVSDQELITKIRAIAAGGYAMIAAETLPHVRPGTGRGTIRIPEDTVMPGPQCDEGPPAASTATPRPRRVKLQHLWLPS